LEFHGRAKGLSGGSEDGERFISSYLDDRAATGLNGLASDRRESRHQPCGSFVAPLLGESRIPADVSDQEGANLGLGPEGPVLAFAGAIQSVNGRIDG